MDRRVRPSGATSKTMTVPSPSSATASSARPSRSMSPAVTSDGRAPASARASPYRTPRDTAVVFRIMRTSASLSVTTSGSRSPSKSATAMSLAPTLTAYVQRVPFVHVIAVVDGHAREAVAQAQLDDVEPAVEVHVGEFHITAGDDRGFQDLLAAEVAVADAGAPRQVPVAPSVACDQVVDAVAVEVAHGHAPRTRPPCA